MHKDYVLIDGAPAVTTVLPAPRRPSTRTPFGVSVSVGGDQPVVVHVRGTVDQLSTPRLQRCLDRHVASRSGFVLDLRGVDFLAVSGLSMLMTLAGAAARDELRWALVADTRAVTRPLRATGIGDLLQLYTELPDAVAAMA